MGAVTKPDKLLSPQVKIACSFMCGCRRLLQDAVFQLGGGARGRGVPTQAGRWSGVGFKVTSRRSRGIKFKNFVPVYFRENWNVWENWT